MIEMGGRFSFVCDRTIFPQGLPDQFSVICTFRTRKPPKTAWNIIRISDIRQRPQFQVTLNPRKNAIEFSIADFQGKLQTLVFRKAQVICINRPFSRPERSKQRQHDSFKREN